MSTAEGARILHERWHTGRHPQWRRHQHGLTPLQTMDGIALHESMQSVHADLQPYLASLREQNVPWIFRTVAISYHLMRDQPGDYARQTTALLLISLLSMVLSVGAITLRAVGV